MPVPVKTGKTGKTGKTLIIENKFTCRFGRVPISKYLFPIYNNLKEFHSNFTESGEKLNISISQINNIIISMGKQSIKDNFNKLSKEEQKKVAILNANLEILKSQLELYLQETKGKLEKTVQVTTLKTDVESALKVICNLAAAARKATGILTVKKTSAVKGGFRATRRLPKLSYGIHTKHKK